MPLCKLNKKNFFLVIIEISIYYKKEFFYVKNVERIIKKESSYFHIQTEEKRYRKDILTVWNVLI